MLGTPCFYIFYSLFFYIQKVTQTTGFDGLFSFQDCLSGFIFQTIRE